MRCGKSQSIATMRRLLPPLLLSLLAHAYTPLSPPSLAALPDPGPALAISGSDSLLAPILVPRVPGTPGHAAVLSYLVAFFRDHLPDWTLELHNSSATTPVSGGAETPFTNLVASRAPPGAAAGDVGYLVLAAHYDSKLTPTGFIGAIDSAAPCAMLLHIARALDAAMSKKWSAAGAAEDGFGGLDAARGVQVILFDGEEAFQHWTGTDSIYGARALAESWDAERHPVYSAFANRLDAMELFVLLDLLGAAGPQVPSYFKTTHWAYVRLAELETRLRVANRLKTGHQTFLTEAAKTDGDRWSGGLIGDDHEPFLARGVEVLHLIPSPFPKVWHEMEDDGAHLDADTVDDWAVLVSGFAAEWLDLDEYMDTTDGGNGRKERRAFRGKSEL